MSSKSVINIGREVINEPRNKIGTVLILYFKVNKIRITIRVVP